MRQIRCRRVFIALMLLAVPVFAHAQADTLRVQLTGLSEPIEIVKDRWGISHIYARNEADLFFAQGYNAARDRLFQFEIWRRRATGTTAEILGPRAIERDIGARLFRFRKDMSEEMRHYHPNGEAIITSFVRGVNAYIRETRADPDLLPIEFELLDIEPQEWTPEVVISRHQGLLGNIGAELDYGRAVALLGPEKVTELASFHPGDPDVALDEAIDGSLLADDILRLYDAFRRPIRFGPRDLVAARRTDEEPRERWGEYREQGSSATRTGGRSTATDVGIRRETIAGEASAQPAAEACGLPAVECADVGSNNWVVMGSHAQSGYPIMANDPHRVHSAPGLRYWVHLNAPGWDVIGGGEPTIPGVSIGHNAYGAWGLTVFSRDGEDLYVYVTHPDDPSQYRYDGAWEDMEVIEEEIAVEGQDPVQAELKYTRHGPVVYEDAENNVAYAVRAAWMEIGGAPYLASLRMDQATSWEEFREACTFHHIPGENMVWADREGHIGWQAAGISPIRPNWSGLVPVPGDGRFEWDGYLPIEELPHVHDPEKGFWATANANLIPPDYEHTDALSYTWADPYRAARVEEVLASGRKHSMMDMMALQTDYLSIPARQLVPLLDGLNAENDRAEEARRMLVEWDHVLDKHSVEAGIYVAWERRLRSNTAERFIPEEARELLGGISMSKMIAWLVSPHPEFGADPVAGRDALLLRSLEEAVSELTDRLGPDMNAWRYGQESYKHALIRHPLSPAVGDELGVRLDVGPLPRGGNSFTVNNTGGGNNQASGASFRIIVDTEDWDRTVGMNAPGQSGDPDSPLYDHLFELWAEDRFIPVYYTRDKVEAVASEVILLEPDR